MAGIELITIPNLLTALRILSIPFFVLLVAAGNLHTALLLFIAAAATDFFDGYLARRFSWQSSLGATLDPLADKLLMSSAFVVLAYAGHLPVWLGAVVLTRDLFMLFGIIMLRRSGAGVNIEPMIAGKVTTFLQAVTVASLLFTLPAHNVLYLVVALITAYGGIEYGLRELDRRLSKSPKERDSTGK